MTAPPPKKPMLSLVQIMVAFALLGIAASLAIPKYMHKVFRERQEECPRELAKIVTAEDQFYELNKRYTTNLLNLAWRPPQEARYLYGFRNVAPEREEAGLETYMGNISLSPSELPETSFSEQAYQIGCVGNIDTDPALDRFLIDQSGMLTHIDDDLDE